MVHTFNPVSQNVEDFFYPQPGRKNAKSDLKLLSFTFSENQQVNAFSYNYYSN